jgi:hypothetical protein
MSATKTKTGTFLVPGVSRNKRRYTPENIGRATARMQARLASGQTIVMHTSHKANAEGDTRATAANVTKVWQDPQSGKGKFAYEWSPTDAAKDTKGLVEAKQLKTVSVFGNWVGDVGKDDDGVESAPDIDISSIDFTHRPGVSGAQLDESLAEYASASGAGIWESFDEGFVDETGSIAEDAEPAGPLAIIEAEQLHVFEDGLCQQCLTEADSTDAKKPYGDVPYADQGFQKDGKKRYPIDTKAHVRSAWSYINKASNAAKYTAKQVAVIKRKIIAAAKKFGIEIKEDWDSLNSVLETLGGEFADLLEAYSSMSLSNGQGNVSVSAYTDEPADLPAVGKAVARAALAGLLNLDPDNDGDVDLGDGNDAPPGDGDAEDAPVCDSCDAGLPEEAMYCPMCGQPVPGAEEAPADERGTQMGTEAKPAETATKKFTLEEAQKIVGEAKHSLLAEGQTEFTADELLLISVAPAPAVKEETELEKARRLVAEADAAEAEKPITAKQMAEMLKEHGETVRTQVREELIEEERRGGSGRIVRRGITESDAERIKGAGFERDSSKLAEMSAAELALELDKGIGALLPG